MPNNSSDNVEVPEVNAQPFTALLEFLCPDDPDEAIRRYLHLHQKLAGFFRLKGMSDPLRDADDTLERAGNKILKSVPIPDIDRFCMGIARKVVLERMRQKRREEEAFEEFMKRSHSDNTEDMDRTNLMKRCFERLSPEDRDLLISYCQVPAGQSRAEHRRQLAASLNSTIAALRIRVTRLRRGLEDCVKQLNKNR